VVACSAMTAAQALADLTEISAQIEGAVLAESDGSVVASTLEREERGAELARAAVELLAVAEESRAEGQELVQLQAVTPRGSVFVVRDGRHVVAALTGTKPTVGLVFYDLKTCLRMLEREEAKADKPAAAPAESEQAEEPAGTKSTVGKAAPTRRKASPKKKNEEAADESS
jgi:predicted regulator of Ras-like GTPase activity (Roadblock/LC7/MglB family)